MPFLKGDLGKADQRIAEARGPLARQRDIIQKLVQGGHDPSDAQALFTSMQSTIETLEEDRRMIEDELLNARAPWG